MHDNGGEFIGEAFQYMLARHGIEDVPTTAKNSKSNAICERMHQNVANILRTKLNFYNDLGNREEIYDGRQLNEEEVRQVIENCLATAQYATRVQTNRSLGVSPGELVYQRDMFINLPVVVDIMRIRDKRQVVIDENLRRENKRRREHHYRIGDEILIKTDGPAKLEEKAHGPYVISRVFTNGTVEVNRNAMVQEKLNIRRIIPFRRM